MTRPRRQLCAFCLVTRTTATLEDGTPICWRPCYATLNKVKGGMTAPAAFLQAFEEVPDGVTLMRVMRRGQGDPEATVRAIASYVYGPLLESVGAPLALGPGAS